MKKKRFIFEVSLAVFELSAVPFVNGFVFAKIKLKGGGGSFAEESKRCSVSDHRVRWDETFSFSCHMSAPASGGILNPCWCRISLRKEMKGGKGIEKMGYVDVNLAQYAGAGQQTKRFLLQGYSDSKRQDNSTLKLGVALTLVKGDPCFKAPPLNGVGVSAKDGLEGSAAGFLHPHSGHAHVALASTMAGPGHSRSSSMSTSMGGHSRQSSLTSSTGFMTSRPSSEVHSRSPSDDMTDGADYVPPMVVPLPISKKIDGGSKRLDHTRLSAVSVVEKLLAVNDDATSAEDSSCTNGLKLYLSHDGSATVAGMNLRASGAYTAVMLPK